MPEALVPMIETARLRLRGHTMEDFAASAALWADANVTRYIMGKPLTEEEVWSRLLRYVGHWQWLGFGFWVVEEKISGRFVGEMGFADYRRGISPSLNRAPELGYVLSTEVHGRGYATEAVRAILAWGDERFQNARTVCLVNPENAISLRVAEKCGYKEFERGNYKGNPTLIMERVSK